MNKLSASALFSCFLFLTSCVPSLNPLYTESDLIFDSALLGAWTDDDSRESWEFTAAGENEYKLVYTDMDGKKGEFEARLLKLDKHLFLDLTPLGPSLSQNDFYAGHILNVHTFVHIIKNGTAFQMSILEPKWLKSHLEKNPGDLRHTTVDGEILITDTSKNLQKFLAKRISDTGSFSRPNTVKRKEQKR